MKVLKKGLCKDCEFCFPSNDDEKMFICANQYYGENITATMENKKDCMTESLESYQRRCEINGVYR